MHKRILAPAQAGSIIVSILIISMFLSTVVMGLIVLANSNLQRARGRVNLLEAQYAAESGADAAVANLNADPSASYAGTAGAEVTVMSNAQNKATFSSTVASGSTSDERVITSIGKMYRTRDTVHPIASRKIEVVAQRSSTTYSATGVLSRNIISIQSGVKNLYAKDLYVNGFINMNKNTTNLVAENITVGGKNTGASNCSIGGSGNLVKPSTFTTAGQTKTNITLAYNNCVSPPGNTSNTNFNVSVNQNNISPIQSTYIPWSQYMDATYTNGYNGCSDWTVGGSVITIPSAGHTKQTQYPDSGSNVTTTCGTSGDLSLGSAQYNITSNVHIRANLCAASSCTPTFYNPTATPVYMFVEGSVNFSGLTTASGSGPIVLVVYGTDPSALTGVCPYGGALYLGNSGTTSAPKIYLLAMNGLCLDKTKFGSNPALGGLSGKNVYIATNPGSPFDLGLDTSFPASAVPVNLAWHAARYRRL